MTDPQAARETCPDCGPYSPCKRHDVAARETPDDPTPDLDGFDARTPVAARETPAHDDAHPIEGSRDHASTPHRHRPDGSIDWHPVAARETLRPDLATNTPRQHLPMAARETLRPDPLTPGETLRDRLGDIVPFTFERAEQSYWDDIAADVLRAATPDPAEPCTWPYCVTPYRALADALEREFHGYARPTDRQGWLDYASRVAATTPGRAASTVEPGLREALAAANTVEEAEEAIEHGYRVVEVDPHLVLRLVRALTPDETA